MNTMNVVYVVDLVFLYRNLLLVIVMVTQWVAISFAVMKVGLIYVELVTVLVSLKKTASSMANSVIASVANVMSVVSVMELVFLKNTVTVIKVIMIVKITAVVLSELMNAVYVLTNLVGINLNTAIAKTIQEIVPESVTVIKKSTFAVYAVEKVFLKDNVIAVYIMIVLVSAVVLVNLITAVDAVVLVNQKKIVIVMIIKLIALVFVEETLPKIDVVYVVTHLQKYLKKIVIASAIRMIVTKNVVDIKLKISVVNVMDQVLLILSATAMELFVIVMEFAVVNSNSMTVESVTEQVISNLSAIVSIIPEIVKEPAAA